MFFFGGGRKNKLTKEEKLQLCKDKLELGISFKQLSQKYLIKQTAIQRLIRKYLIHGESIFNEKNRNSSYSKEFKYHIVSDFLKGYSKNELAIKYNLSNRVVEEWINKYNSNIELNDYFPRGEIYTMKSKKYSRDEKIEIAKECIENNKNYKDICTKYSISYPTLYRWVLKLEREYSCDLKNNNFDTDSKLEILLKLKEIEIERLKSEIEILKKNEEIEDMLEKMGK